MTNNEKQYTIYIRSTKTSVPVSKEEFDAYYKDINSYRRTKMNRKECVCPKNKWLSCDMDCLTCPYKRYENMLSLDYINTNDYGDEFTITEQIADTTPLIDEIITDKSFIEVLFKRLLELMPESLLIGELRLQGFNEEEIAEKVGIGRKTFYYRLKKAKSIIEKEFSEIL